MADTTNPTGYGGDDWLAWPGGQADVAFNPVEVFKSSDFGFDPGEKVDWDVGGNTDCVGTIIGESGSTATNKDTLWVRYDSFSKGPWRPDACEIIASKGGAAKLKARTVFKATWVKLNFTEALDPQDPLRFPLQTGTNVSKAEFNWPGERGAEAVAAKMEAICEFSPEGIDWIARGVKFDRTGTGDPPRTPKGWCRPQRLIQGVGLAQYKKGEGGTIPKFRNIAQNAAGWAYDGKADPYDSMMPTIKGAVSANRVFRLDWPGIGAGEYGAKQVCMRANLIEILEWSDGDKWSRMTPDDGAKWYVNITGDLPDLGKGAPNASGAGHYAVVVANSRPVASAGTDQTVSVTSPVMLDGSGSTDADNDSFVYKWRQTAGPVVQLDSDSVQLPKFTAPDAPAVLKFELIVTDVTSRLNHFKPDNSASAPIEVTVTVVNS